MHKKLLAIISLLICARSSAQVTLAPEVGLQMVNMRQKTDNTAYINAGYVVLTPEYKAALRAGLNIVADINDISIHAGVFYTARGYKISYMGDLRKVNLDYVDIPVYVNYNLSNKRGDKFFAGAGPYLSYCVGAKAKLKNPSGKDEYNFRIGTNSMFDDIKPIDLGANANLGFMSAIGIYVRAQYSLGLTNTMPGGNSKESLKNTAFGISAGYMIKLKKKQ